MPRPWQTHVDADSWGPMELDGEIVGEVHSLRSDDGERPFSKTPFKELFVLS